MRMEHDLLGDLPVPDDAYYGIQTVRCAANYDVTDRTFNDLPEVIRAVAEVKKACAITNAQIGALDKKKAAAIEDACDEIIAGKMAGQFPVNVWRSHGTGVNMNVNEVIANRANEILTGHKGYDAVHPNTHVNVSIFQRHISDGRGNCPLSDDRKGPQIRSVLRRCISQKST